jgi:hypothetical protein
MTWLDVLRLMELNYSPAQFDIEPVSAGGKLNDMWMFKLVRGRFSDATHISPQVVPF